MFWVGDVDDTINACLLSDEGLRLNTWVFSSGNNNEWNRTLKNSLFQRTATNL